MTAAAIALLLTAAAPLPAAHEGALPPRWDDPQTGRQVVRISHGLDSGRTFYFHQNMFTASGDLMVYAAQVDGQKRFYVADTSTWKSRQLTGQVGHHEVVAPKRRELFYLWEGVVYATKLDGGETRKIAEIPKEWGRGSGLTVNTDETLLAGSFAEGVAAYYQRPRSEWFVDIYEAHLPNGLYAIDIETGEVEVFHRENNWLGHVQFSPTDPEQLMFCHEGPWERVQRIWLIRRDGSGLKPVHERTVQNEIAGHEFWGPDGERVWFDLQIPMWRNFYLAGADIETGDEVRYPLEPKHWSYHFTIAQDGSFFVGDGGAVRHGHEGGNAIWKYARQGAQLQVEPLCYLEGHDYAACEPNVHITPNGRWAVFTSNMHGARHIYAVETEERMPKEPKPHMGDFHPILREYADAHGPSMSYLAQAPEDLEAWQAAGRAKMRELLRYEPERRPLEPKTLETVRKDGYVRRLVRYWVTADRQTEAFLLIPDGLDGPAPAVVALHCHSGFYYYGKEKITDTEAPLPALQELIDGTYGGRGFASELARRGFVVLAPDAFYFGSQRLDPESVAPRYGTGLAGLEPGTDAYVRAYQGFAGAHEELTAKTLFTAGTTWPGVLFQGDRASVDYLLTRPEVDPDRIGCMGLSIGGFRSAHLFGLDPRLKCGVVAGWMTSYGSLLREHLWCHTWMIYVPGQHNFLDLPDVVTLSAPRPVMVINCLQDMLFPLDGMKSAEEKLRVVYEKLGAPERFSCAYYDEPHSLKLPAQEDAVAWLERWLAP